MDTVALGKKDRPFLRGSVALSTWIRGFFRGEGGGIPPEREEGTLVLFWGTWRGKKMGRLC